MRKELTVPLILPVIGTEYRIYLRDKKTPIYDEDKRTVKGVYIGSNPTKTPWFFEIKKPEGHIFVVKNPDRKLEFYCDRNESGGIHEAWMSDGEDGPEWPVGISVRNINFIPTKKQTKYLNKFFQNGVLV